MNSRNHKIFAGIMVPLFLVSGPALATSFGHNGDTSGIAIRLAQAATPDDEETRRQQQLRESVPDAPAAAPEPAQPKPAPAPETQAAPPAAQAPASRPAAEQPAIAPVEQRAPQAAPPATREAAPGPPQGERRRDEGDARRGERPDRGERTDRGERPDREERPNRSERSEPLQPERRDTPATAAPPPEAPASPESRPQVAPPPVQSTPPAAAPSQMREDPDLRERIEQRRERGTERDRGDRRTDQPRERPILDRREIIEREDGRTVTRDGDSRVIIRENNRIIINSDDSGRLSRDARDVRTDRNRDGTSSTTVVRPDGTRVTTVRDANGDIISRTRVAPGGREIRLIEDRRDDRQRRGGGRGIGPLIELPPLRLNIPRERYIVEADEAPVTVLEETLIAPPVESVERAYSLGELRRNYRVLEKVRSINLNAITFEFGAWEVADSQIGKLESLGTALEQIIKANPDEVFLVEGHTDAVGSNEDNLALSDRRAESVAVIFTEHFDIPAENLITQGYGEEQLKVDTQSANSQNRRVVVRRITSLLTSQR